MKAPHRNSAVMEQIERWLAHLQKQGRRPRTVRTYRDALLNLCRFLRRHKIARPGDIQRHHMIGWSEGLVKCGFKAATCNLYIRVTQCWLAWLVDAGVLFFNPAEALIRPKTPVSFGRCPTEAEMHRLLESVSHTDVRALRDRALLELAYATGARCEEIVRLDLLAVDFSRRAVALRGKGGKERMVPLTSKAVSALETYVNTARRPLLRGRENEAAFFIGQRAGRRMAGSAIAHMVRRQGARIGLTLSPHDIRRAFATHLLNGGAGPMHLKELLGHADLSHLHHYLVHAPTDMLATVRASSLNE